MRQTRSFRFSLIQGLDGGGPAILPPRILRAEDHKFGLTLPTVAPSPNRRHSVSSAPPCIAFQRVEVRTGRFSEGIFATSSKTYIFAARLPSRGVYGLPIACRKTHRVQESQDDSRNLTNIAIDFTHRQHIVHRVGMHPTQEPFLKDC
jgi:hypothetical protein